MNLKKIIVATACSRDLERWQQVISDRGDMRIVAHAPGLMELFNKVEHDPPNIVLVSDDLGAADDFEPVVTLFDTLDVRWLRFTSLENRPPNRTGTAGRSERADLFDVSLHDSPAALFGQVVSLSRAAQRAERPKVVKSVASGQLYKRMVLIGSSTGGVDALKAVLSKFGPDCPPTVVVQHTTQGFGEGLCRVLARASAANVRLFEPDTPLQSGTVHMVSGLPNHVVLLPGKRPYLKANHEPPVSGHLPSIDKLFLSFVPYANRVVGCILTGMGSDGAAGLLKLREAGARTVSQDRDSSVVYGMPAAAWSNGASMKQVALSSMGERLLKEAAL